ncbi:MAG TPA: prolyl oligopeptidase family serine peptidase, partial [Bacillota bacterium]|nr:prolyl oligopeptidase family serine peptidase [Bacillota bacterium]
DTRWLAVPGDPRNHYLAHMDWASNSTEVILQQFNRCQNTNLLLLADAQTGQTRPILTETDPAWVENDNATRFLAKGKQLLWLSERDGWRHLYRVSRDGREASCLTKGKYDVTAIEGIDEELGWLYFTASPDNPTQRYLYRLPLKGGKAERLTPASQPGTHAYNLSPDARWAIHTCSSFTNPPVTDLIRLPDHTTVRVLEDNQKLRTKLCTLKRPASEFFRVPVAKNLQLDGWCLLPPDFDPARKYPVLFYVYGEPAGQTVLDSWRDKSGLWHWMLAQQGYVVMSVDNRGTPAPRGRAWRKSIHHQIGRLNSADQAAAVRALLQARPYLDPTRVGVWGWSGGGSSTLHAMLQYPDLYRTGMAVASVPNQRYYDSIYEERYMGLPQDNPEGYRLGSPITYASRLKGNLLIVHGTGDDNVHYQGAEALINELVSNQKPFTMMAYPNRSHSINEGKNTTYHLYSLLTRYLQQHLPAGAGPGV